jgi:hypothetical protein
VSRLKDWASEGVWEVVGWLVMLGGAAVAVGAVIGGLWLFGQVFPNEPVVVRGCLGDRVCQQERLDSGRDLRPEDVYGDPYAGAGA